MLVARVREMELSSALCDVDSSFVIQDLGHACRQFGHHLRFWGR
jgi:hypothetical protein